MEAIRQNGKIILHSNDGTSMKMIFKKQSFYLRKSKISTLFSKNYYFIGETVTYN